MAEETTNTEIPIEQLSAYSLYLVQESLAEYEKQGARKDTLDRNDYRDWLSGDIVRRKYKAGDKYSIEDEYRYLLAETDFEATPGFNYEGAVDAANEAAAAVPEADRIDQEYADGIGIVNQALEESTLADDVMGPPVDPTNITVDAEPVSISSPENNAGKLGGINSFKKAYNKAEAVKLSSIKNTSINI